MRIDKILNSGKISLSFEVFPPKNDAGLESVRDATERIASLKPSYVSVTYGAGGNGSRYTLDIAEGIEKNTGVPTLVHLTCIGSDKNTVRERLFEIKDKGFSNILALRGDIPSGMEHGDVLRDYTHASDLVREIKTLCPDFCIGAACYPEIHPESKNSREDIERLKYKVDCGVDFLTTQMFFDNNLLYNFLYRIREAGISVPVVAGIMPITNAKQIERAIKLSGSFMPGRFKSLVDRFGNDPLAMKQAGIAYATDQIIDLFANGVNNVHVYTMNNPDVAERITKSLSDIIGK
ncbi:MAG: methylenetetrahydrofolate reductase [Clostridia bacterium]|nr:methylenetetrahydrofolate reductase [NAD(P)H] [Clostridia bacterium]